MAFESLTLTPFRLEILGVRKLIFNVLTVISVRFWLESGKICKNTSTFFIFYNCFADIPFFSPGRDQLLGRAGQKNISPGISPLRDFWIPGLDSCIWLGRYAWAKSLVSRAILV